MAMQAPCVARTYVRYHMYRTLVRSLSDRAKQERTKALLDKIIRIDHAGEFGAKRIYQGQLAVLRDTSSGPVIQEMQEEEEKHLAEFEKLMRDHRARPTVLLPLWNIAGFALGAGTALLGKEGAMACTVAVESVIGQHYNDQIRELMEDDPEKHKALLKTLKEFRDDELHHHDTGLEHDAEKGLIVNSMDPDETVGIHRLIWIHAGHKGTKQVFSWQGSYKPCRSNHGLQAPFYKAMTEVIKVGCKGAIWISEKV